MAEKQPAKRDPAETAPDPDEDDLDDLDEVLDSFQNTSISANQASKPAPSSSGPGRPPEAAGVGPNAASDDFAAQLQAGMSNLISELDDNPDMQKQFEKMMQELIAAGEAGTDEAAMAHIAKAAEATPHTPSAPATPNPETAGGSKKVGGSAKKKTAEDSFQDTIRRTMERMQASGDQATSAAQQGASGSSEDELFAQMMRELSGGAGAGGTEEDFNKLLLTMMTQLTNKEILYEPMLELHEKFPGWMEANKDKVSKDDLTRYQEQQKFVAEIVARFQKTGYSDDNEDDREFIVDRMQKMQAAGSPPPDLVGDMSAAQEALGDLDAGCPTQ